LNSFTCHDPTLRKCLVPGVVAHTRRPSTGEWRQQDCDFEASLGSILSLLKNKGKKWPIAHGGLARDRRQLQHKRPPVGGWAGDPLRDSEVAGIRPRGSSMEESVTGRVGCVLFPRAVAVPVSNVAQQACTHVTCRVSGCVSVHTAVPLTCVLRVCRGRRVRQA
jgi:hypothetical protein